MIDSTGNPAQWDDFEMEHRLTVLETKLETILPNLATKEDIHKLESAFVKWGVGFALGIVGLVIGYLSLTRVTPAQPNAQPIVIQLPAAHQASAPVVQPAPAQAPPRQTP
jgi:hypothetical protein